MSSLAGSYFFCEPRGSILIYDPEHQITLALFVCVGIYLVYLSNLLARDIARRMIVESELRQAEETLRHHQAELAHAARLSSLGEMAASLAHELNQPLCAVNNYADGCLRHLRKRDELDSELIAVLRQIADETNRAAKIVRRVRNFAQKRQSVASATSIAHLIEESVSISQSEIDRSKVTVCYALGPNLPTVMVDPVQIEQVLINLLRNALEAMANASLDDRCLTIRAEYAEVNSVEVIVSDRGKGIAADQREKIFEPFFTTKPEGMGLGLAICRSIIQAHGGHIWADANADRGTSIHFTLPALAAR
jgi:C4-dicarboxylate-specific signal transduction histidine kinase